MDHIDKLIEIVRKSRDPQKAWSEIFRLCQTSQPSPMWNKLPQPDIAGDIVRARTWLMTQISQSKVRPRGIYLGLDTLNMNEGRGKNVELGFSSKADPAVLDMDWIFNCEAYGADHLISSLVGMKKLYDADEETSSFADYMLFLGYSGLILLAAIESAPLENDFIAIWGFHDGDMAFLVRSVDGQIERLVKF